VFFCPDVATAAAITAAGASRLRNSGNVDVFLKTDDHRWRDWFGANRAGRCRKSFKFQVFRSFRIAGWPKPAPCAPESFREKIVLRHLAGPDFIGKHPRIRLQRDSRVDQRASAEAAADQHVHVVTEANVIKRRLSAHVHSPAAYLELVSQIRKTRGKFAGQKLASAFENGYALAGACQA